MSKLVETFKTHKNRLVAGSAVLGGALASMPVNAFASSNDTTQNLTTGMSGFIGLVTTMIETILGSPTLQIAFAASFAFLAVRLIKKLKKT